MGKEILKLTCKKNKIQHDPILLANELKSERYQHTIFQVDEGKTDNGFQFLTVRIYSKIIK